MKNKRSVGIILIVFFFITFYSYGEEERGINQEQPIAPGEWIYRTYFYVQTPNAPAVEFTIYYKGIEDQNIVVECQFEGVKTFKISLNPAKQAFLNTTDYKSTLLLTVVDDQNRITIEETEYKKDIPIRFYPDLQKPVIHKSDDFEDNTGIVDAIEKGLGVPK